MHSLKSCIWFCLSLYLFPCSQDNYILKKKFIETSVFCFRSPGHSAAITTERHGSAIFAKKGAAVIKLMPRLGRNLSINLPAGLKWKEKGYLRKEGEIKRSIFLISSTCSSPLIKLTCRKSAVQASNHSVRKILN